MKPRRKEISKECQNFKLPENPETHNQHQKAVCNYCRLKDYTVSKSFPLLNFLFHQAISLTSIDPF